MSGHIADIRNGTFDSASIGWFAASKVVYYSPLIVILVLWQLAGFAGVLPRYLPAPSTITAEIYTQFVQEDMLTHTIISLQRVYVGFFVGSFLGVALGVIAGRFNAIGKMFDPLVSSTYPVPKIAIYPVLIIWLGIGFLSSTAVILLAAFYPVYINTYDGARNVDTMYIWSAQNFNASHFETLLKVVIPGSLSHIFSGLRISLALSFIVLFSAELISSRYGLGYVVIQGQRANNFTLMFAAIVVIAVLGFTNDRILNAVRKRVLGWKETSGGE